MPCISILRNHWAALAVTDHIHSNSYTNTHRPTRRLSLDKQCRLAIIISTVTCHVTTVASDNWLSRCPLKFPMPPADNHSHRQPPQCSAAWVVVHGVWRRSDFNVVARCLLYFTKSISAICRFAHVLACSDVAVFWCPMCTSAELYMIHVTSSNGKYMWAAFWTP